MTSTNKRDGGEVEPEELWLPTHVMQYYTVEQYAEQSCALAESRAECRKWREKYEDAWAEAGAQSEARAFAEARSERLAEALRELVALGHPNDPPIIAASAALNLEPTP